MDERTAIEKIQKGEKEAFRFLVESFQNLAVAHAFAILGSRADAEDAAQEAFIDAFRALSRFDNSKRFYPWFYVLLRHRCYKMTARRRETENLEELEIVAREIPHETPVGVRDGHVDVDVIDPESKRRTWRLVGARAGAEHGGRPGREEGPGPPMRAAVIGPFSPAKN